MTTTQIETYADIGGISSPDINLKVLLRRNVVPAFLSDVGYVSWRRQHATLALSVAGGKQYNLADDFWQMQSLTIDPDSSKSIQYIGDDPEKVMAAELNTTPGKPTGYYLVRRVTTLLFQAVKFNYPPDQDYTARYTYYSTVPFADDTTEVELDKYLPSQFQWALVEGLKKEILFLRFGIGDPRYVAAEQAHRMWIERASENPELARRNLAAFVR
jgi:hypothetical protein